MGSNINWEELARETLAELQKELADIWNALSPEVKQDLGRLATMYAEVILSEMVGDKKDEQKALLKSSLDNYKWIARSKVKKALGKAVKSAVWNIVGRIVPLI